MIGYSQARIAKESGVPQPTISRIVTGLHKNPRMRTVQALVGLSLKAKPTPAPTSLEIQATDTPDKGEKAADTASAEVMGCGNA